MVRVMGGCKIDRTHQRKFGGVLTTAKRTYWNTGTQSIVTASYRTWLALVDSRLFICFQ